MGNMSDGFSSILYMVFVIIFIVGMWKLFEKAGEAGWKSLIPIYQLYIQFKIVYGNGWKVLWLLVPLANIYFIIMFCLDLAKVFGKGVGYGLGLLFGFPLFSVILGFDDSEYLGPKRK
ncbi:DUF5684 domain-containing protein [Facklamia sp. P12945]|uniref:DUF5684 domain-containing protein n=1 Tax=unclassified Facklamia TaxID=2622293 RepID=UPI003D179C8C